MDFTFWWESHNWVNNIYTVSDEAKQGIQGGRKKIEVVNLQF